MKANLNSLADGVIVVGLGGFLFSIAYTYSQSIPQSSPNYFVVGFFALSLALIIGGILKIVNALSKGRADEGSTLKTPVAAFLVGLVMMYYSFSFIYRL